MPDMTSSPRWLWYALLTLFVVILAVAGYGGYNLYPRFALPATQGASLLLLAAAAGIGSFFSPCSFPLLVTLLARQSGSAEQPDSRPSTVKALSFAAALALGSGTFLLLSGMILALGGDALFAGVTFMSVQGRVIRFVVEAALVILGLIQLGLLPFTLDAVARVANPLMRSQARQRKQRPLLAFAIFGFAYPLAGFG
jgi:cytochrome c biogenesis protein CcdA